MVGLRDGVIIPIGVQSGPLQPFLLAAYRRLANRAPKMGGITDPLILADGTILHHGGIPSFSVAALAEGRHEPAMTEWLRPRVPVGGTFVDVGAHVGIHSLGLANLVGPEGRGFAFEPNPASYERLVRNIGLNGFGQVVEAQQVAVSDARGTGDLYIYRDDSGSASLSRRSLRLAEEIGVETIRLDDWYETVGRPPIHVIKIDVEGAEVKVLNGMRGVIATNPDILIIVELNSDALTSSGESPASLRRALTSLGLSEVTLLSKTPRLLSDERAWQRAATRAQWIPINLAARKPHRSE